MLKSIFRACILAGATSLLSFSVAAQGAGDIKVVSTGSKSMSDSKPQPAKPKGYDRLGKADYECVYAYDVVATRKNGDKVNEEYATILQFNPSVAKFTDMTAFRVDSLGSTSGADPEAVKKLQDALGKVEYLFTGEVFQNSPEGKTRYVDIITPNTVEYAEDFAPFDWTLSEDTLTVCDYPCMKATCSYGGRDWTAWFTEEIPAGFGPWKFAGLPGLIMKVSDADGIHTFTATALRKGTGDIVKVQNSQLQSTSRDKFVKAKNYFEEDPMKRIPVESIKDVTVFKGGAVLINGVYLPKRPNGYTPIELR